MALEQIYTASCWETVTPNDTTDLSRNYKAIFVGTGGDLYAVGANGVATAPHKNVANGTLLLIRPKRILTSSTASDLVGYFDP